MPLPASDDLRFPAALWQPRPRSGGPEEPLPITRRDELGIETAAASADGSPLVPGPAFGEGPRVISRDGDTALVHFRHAAHAATAVALQANGWWRPEPREACDLRPTGNGWWEGTFEVPADWRATYGYVEHEEDGDPPWWESGLKDPGAPVVSDLSNPRRHRAARGGAQRAVICVPDDGPFTPGLVRDGEPSPLLHTLATREGEPVTRWWASRPGDPGCEDLDPSAPLPLLIVTDGLQHVDQLGTPSRLRRGVAAGILPPLAAVFVESGPSRSEVLGVPGGHARWIAEQLAPRLREEGLRDSTGDVPLTDQASRTIVTGSSFGGLTALFAVARAPQLIGTAIAQSVSLWRYEEGALVEPLRRAARQHPLRLRLHAGRFEGTMPARAAALLDGLTAGAGTDDRLDATLAVHSGGHDWAWWQPMMLQELAALLR
ncbi:alpha/beta hydrolase [Brachybacterium alimentarium]|uniref:alpha/beta hydrolase n=1 Tax=Brachybacterium alimentarium TaxID=47845 RepID=UPI003FD55059